MLQRVGTIMLGLGFAMLVGAMSLWDPTPDGVSVGVGILCTVGVPVGTVGVALTVSHAVYKAWERANLD